MAEDTTKKVDQELEEFRRIMEVPSRFDEGFNWGSLLGALFVGLMMVPGAVYMRLMAGQGIGPAARWVTVILFIEVARRAQKSLKRAEIFVLFYMVGAAIGMPFYGLHWRQFFVRSDAAVAFGIAELLPGWYAPSPDSESYAARTFLHLDWLPVVGLVVFQTFMSRVKYMVLGYGFFRIASDIERLPFPMAPVGAAGVMALADDADDQDAEKRENSWRWRVFAIGGAIGLVFGFLYLLVPTLTGALSGTPVTIFPIPFVDWTQKTGHVLPAVATGINLNLLQFITGMVLPFWAMVGKFAGLIFTFILNPVLYHFEVLHSWTNGDNTMATLFKNRVDFYFSFTIGVSLAIAAAGLSKVVQAVRAKRNQNKEQVQAKTLSEEYLKERGDIPKWVVLGTYFFVTFSYIILSGFLIDWHKGVMIMLFFFGFVYTPFISYVTARLEGIAGMAIRIPMITEASFILSGYQGVSVWFIPIPMTNYGDNEVVFYRQCELTGTKFKSIWKTELILTPIILVISILYMSYIWGLAEIPSAAYPFAQRMWELQAANMSIMYSATLGEYSIFEYAWNWTNFFAGFGGGLLLFGIMSWFSAPVFLTYGVIQGLDQTLPHQLLMQFAGALVGRLYFHRRMGLRWRQYVPVLAAGAACGMGLIATVGVGISFLAKSVMKMPF